MVCLDLLCVHPHVIIGDSITITVWCTSDYHTQQDADLPEPIYYFSSGTGSNL